MRTHHTTKHVWGMATVLLGLMALVFISSGIKTLSMQYPGLASAIGSFSIWDSANVIKLEVPYFRQQYANSCESASLRMVLAYYGIESDDMEIVQRIGYKPRLKDVVKNEWDDPHEQFVGFIDISGSTYGYGVYGLPVAYAAGSFGREAEYRTVITPQFLAKEISEGHPIIIWGYTSITAPPYTWNLPNGGIAKVFRGEHARVVVGMRGSIIDPLGFYVHDPINGKQFQYWSASELINHMYGVVGVTNQAVVVK